MTKKKKRSSVFSEGDIVSLNIDGAPSMIVHSAEGDQIICDWFDGKSLCRKPFHEKELISAAPSPDPRDVARAILSILREAPGDQRIDEGLKKTGEAFKEASQDAAASVAASPLPSGERT